MSKSPTKGFFASKTNLPFAYSTVSPPITEPKSSATKKAFLLGSSTVIQSAELPANAPTGVFAGCTLIILGVIPFWAAVGSEFPEVI